MPSLGMQGRALLAAAEAAQRCLVWTQRDQRLWKLPETRLGFGAILGPVLPCPASPQELTDERRARLLHELATSGRLPLTQLLGSGESPRPSCAVRAQQHLLSK